MATLTGELPSGATSADPSAAYNPAMYELLKTIDDPAQLRALERKQLRQLADELRAFVLESVSKTGGHLSSNLGTVELTIALLFTLNENEMSFSPPVGALTNSLARLLSGRVYSSARRASEHLLKRVG